MSRTEQTKGAFTPDANEALSASDLHVKSMQRRELADIRAALTNQELALVVT